MEFLTLDPESFEYGKPVEVVPGVRRVIAKNPSKFTYHGTGTYIIGKGDIAVVDPGPRIDSHRDALAAAIEGENVVAILITHCHSDHSPLAAWLREKTGAPTIAYGPHGADTDPNLDLGKLPDDFGRVPKTDEDAADSDSPLEDPPMEEGPDMDFVPDVEARTGDIVASGDGWQVEAIFTPGHTSNHTCFALTQTKGSSTGVERAADSSTPADDAGPSVLFTGDHVMGWSTTVVGPPDGEMGAYIESLRAIAERNDDVALPTHGPPITNPQEYIRGLIAHRLDREAQVVGAVGRGLDTIPEMVTELYAATPVFLHRPAAASVLSHLFKLVDDGAVRAPDGVRLDGRFLPAS